MKKLITFLICFSLLITGCSIGKEKLLSKEIFAMDTIITVKLYSQHKALYTDIEDKIKEIEKLMSISIIDSDVNNINKNAGVKPVRVSEETLEVLLKAKRYHQLTDDSFQVTIYPLVKLWDIKDPDVGIPDDTIIQETKSLADSSLLVIDKQNSTAFLKDINAGIDLGAIAKGYAADQVAKLLKDKGVNRALISLGGGIKAIGGKFKDTPWVLGLENPVDVKGEHFAVTEIYNGSIVTSGDYQRYKTVDGVKYHHILSSKTGYPAKNELASVSIFTENSFDADAISTAAYVMGLTEGYHFVSSLEGVEAMFVTHDKRVYLTAGLINRVFIQDKGFTIDEIRR